MNRKKLLFICGTLNQTTMMHKISEHLWDYDCYFTPFYSNGFLHYLAQNGLLDFTVLGGQVRRNTENYLISHGLNIDYGGISNNYALVLSCSDLYVQENIRNKKIILVQEGMTDPENFKYYFVKNLGLPRYFVNTSMTGLSHAYQTFCVASEGFKEVFLRKGVNPEKISVTGLPNFDNVKQYLNNDFPYKHYVLAATSHLRESFKYENRKKFIQDVLAIADGKQVIFKLHPNERIERATREIMRYAPDSLIISGGNINHMIANCDILVTKYSTVVLIAQALGKEIYSDLDPGFLQKLSPIQNGGKSAENIANICQYHLN